MLYLTMHSTHFYIRLHSVVYRVKDNSDHKREKEGRKEGNVLFNDALNTFLYTEGRKCFI